MRFSEDWLLWANNLSLCLSAEIGVLAGKDVWAELLLEDESIESFTGPAPLFWL